MPRRFSDPGGAAEKAGIKKGDALVDVDGQPVKTIADVRLLFGARNPESAW
jgi:S1-C subfamily serine protease